jgi:hypothetical protein
MIPELFKMISSRITPGVLEMVNNYLSDEQIALLLVKNINPYIVLSLQDEAKLRGVHRKTLRGMKERGEVSSKRGSEIGVNMEEAPNRPKNSHKSVKYSHSGPDKSKPM